MEVDYHCAVYEKERGLYHKALPEFFCEGGLLPAVTYNAAPPAIDRAPASRPPSRVTAASRGALWEAEERVMWASYRAPPITASPFKVMACELWNGSPEV